jgi:hypothetical protein
MKISTGNRRRNITIISIVGLIIALFATAIAAPFLSSKFAVYQQGVVRADEKQPFPDIDASGLTAYQQKVVALLKQEYAAQEPGTKYSEGASEPWCADFVSWIMREAGSPLENPNSGSWRIPGVATLQAYYQSSGAFQPYSSGYQPVLGDVVMYGGDGIFGQHTNIVLKNDNGILTTIGGNENGKIRVYTNEDTDGARIVGYGVLEK